jgi:hypothetical protein
MAADNSEDLIPIAVRGDAPVSVTTRQRPQHQIDVSLPDVFVGHMEIARGPMPGVGGARFGRMKTIIFRHRASSRGAIPTE